MKVLKKPITLALVIALAVVFSALASASSAIPDTGILEVGNNGVLDDSSDALSEITFSVKLSNTESGPRPGTLFEYTVSESGTANGPIVGNESVTFGLNNNGAEDTKNVTLNITATSDTVTPGVHTYTITQAIDDAASAAGFAVGLATAYLDLYVNNNHEVYGAVLRNAEIPQDAANPDDYKIAGFENTYTPTSVNVSKVVTGAAGVGHAGDNFTFVIEIKVPYDVAYVNTASLPISFSGAEIGFTNTSVGDSPTVDADGFITLNATGTLKADGVSEALEGKTKNDFSNLSHTMSITGLPANSTVTVKETITGDYKATAKKWSANSELSLTGVNEVVAANNDTYPGVEVTGGESVVYINDLEYEYISPTGVALRYAPYLFMLGAGVTLPAMSLRRRKEEEF